MSKGHVYLEKEDTQPDHSNPLHPVAAAGSAEVFRIKNFYFTAKHLTFLGLYAYLCPWLSPRITTCSPFFRSRDEQKTFRQAPKKYAVTLFFQHSDRNSTFLFLHLPPVFSQEFQL